MKLPKNLPTSSINIGSYINTILYLVEGVVFFILIFYYFVPSYNEIKTIREDISQKQVELSRVTKYANYLKELANTKLELEESIVNYSLPSENDVITLILTYEGLASQNEQVVVSPIELAPGVLEQEEDGLQEGSSGIQSVDFSMDITAEDSDAARTFIEELTNTRRIFDIQNLSWVVPDLSATQSEDLTEDSIELAIDISTYYFLDIGAKTSQDLVQQGQTQGDFINQLRSTMVFEDLILKDIELGKEDLFEKITTDSARLN